MKKELLVLGGLGAATVVAALVASKGNQQSYGVAFAAPDPNAVAAVENGISSQIAAMNAAGIQRATNAGAIVLGLAGAQKDLLTSQISASEQLNEVRMTTQAAVDTAGINADAATKQAKFAADATVAASTALANAQTTIAGINANAQTDIARNQTTQAQAAAGAQKTSSFWNALGNIASSVIHFFNPAPSQQPTSTQVSYSPEVGPAAPSGVSFG